MRKSQKMVWEKNSYFYPKNRSLRNFLFLFVQQRSTENICREFYELSNDTKINSNNRERRYAKFTKMAKFMVDYLQ